VHPETWAKIQAFTNHSLLPAFVEIKEHLATSHKLVIIARNAETGNDAVDAMLRQMHCRQLSQASVASDTVSEQPQVLIGDSLYVEILQDLDTEPMLDRQYCLSIEFRIEPTESSTAQIQLTSVIGSNQLWHKSIQMYRYPFEDTLGPLNIEEIDSSDIILNFTKSFQAFEAQIPDADTLFKKDPEVESLTHALTHPSKEFDPAQPNLADPAEQTIPLEALAEPSQISQAEPAQPPVTLTPQQQLQALHQKAIDLSQQLAPTSDNPLNCRFNPDQPEPAQIIALHESPDNTLDLCLEYGPTITESELLEQLQRLSHYQALKQLGLQHHALEAQLQTWLKLYKQPSPGAIAPHLQQHLPQQSQTLYHRLQILSDTCLDTLTAPDLLKELERFTTQHQQQQDRLDALTQNPILGYLEASHLEGTIPLPAINPFIHPTPSLDAPIELVAQHLHRKDQSLQLTLIETCSSERYQAYQQRFCADETALDIAIRYALTQKLYPNRTFSIGPCAKDAYPRLELLWGGTAETTPPNHPFTQLWRIFPMIRMHSPQWLVMTATSETQRLKTIALADGRLAQEGTREYLVRSLELMTQSADKYTHDVGAAVIEALAKKQMRWMHLHQTEDLETGEPRDIVQLWFQLGESG
jgi:hypothetical protein